MRPWIFVALMVFASGAQSQVPVGGARQTPQVLGRPTPTTAVSVPACVAQARMEMARQRVNLDFLSQADRDIMTAHCQCLLEQQRGGGDRQQAEAQCSTLAQSMGRTDYSSHFVGRYRAGN